MNHFFCQTRPSSGLGTTPEKSKSLLPWKNLAYRTIDKKAAQAVEVLFESAERVRLQRTKLEIVGSKRAALSFAKCYGTIEEYLATVMEHILDDGRFIYDDYVRYMNLYDQNVTKAIDLFRADLRTKN